MISSCTNKYPKNRKGKKVKSALTVYVSKARLAVAQDGIRDVCRQIGVLGCKKDHHDSGRVWEKGIALRGVLRASHLTLLCNVWICMYFCHGYLLRLETCVVQLEDRLHLKMQLCIFLGISFAVITCVTFLSCIYCHCSASIRVRSTPTFGVG